MKITFIGHASVLIEANGLKILSDPWWHGPCFGAQWWNYPAPHVAAVDTQGIDYIYISHGHHDHYHPGTLRTFARSTRILVSSRIDLAESIREHGFEVMEVDDDEVRDLGQGVYCRIMETHAEDTLMVIDDGKEICVNLNDALHATPRVIQDKFIAWLNDAYPRIDYVFCGYGVASHFPNCYRLPGKDAAATAAHRQHHFNGQWSHIISGLHPRFGFPFAADVAFLEQDLQWANEPTHNRERPTDLFRREHPSSSTQVVDIAPGFCVEDGRVTDSRLRAPTVLSRLVDECADGVVRANRYGQVSPEEIAQLAELLTGNIALCREYLAVFPGDYRIAMRFRNTPAGMLIEKRGDDIQVATRDRLGADDEYDLVFVTRAPYLRRSLTTRYGHEILFVGSGGIFTYTSTGQARRALHRELMVMMTRQDQPMRAGQRPPTGVWVRTKRVIKRLIGRDSPDLYDLLGWTVGSA